MGNGPCYPLLPPWPSGFHLGAQPRTNGRHAKRTGKPTLPPGFSLARQPDRAHGTNRSPRRQRTGFNGYLRSRPARQCRIDQTSRLRPPVHPHRLQRLRTRHRPADLPSRPRNPARQRQNRCPFRPQLRPRTRQTTALRRRFGFRKRKMD